MKTIDKNSINISLTQLGDTHTQLVSVVARRIAGKKSSKASRSWDSLRAAHSAAHTR